MIAVDEIEHQMNTTQLYSSTVQYSTIKLYSFITYRMMTMQCSLLTKRKCTVGKNAMREFQMEINVKTTVIVVSTMGKVFSVISKAIIL